MRGNKHPHVKASMFHGVDGIDGMILREEVMVILLVMISRLSNEDFKKHAVVPVCHLHSYGKRFYASGFANPFCFPTSRLCYFRG